MRVLVCGGRDYEEKMKLLGYNPEGVVFNTLHEHVNTDTDTIISGLAKGIDTIAAHYAHIFTMPLFGFPAKWNKYGKRAGYLRNKQMLDEGKPDLVIAFPGGRGTNMMVKLAKEANVEVIQIAEISI